MVGVDGAISIRMPAGNRAAAAKNSARETPAVVQPSTGTVEAFHGAVDRLAGVEHRTMFGSPSVFLNDDTLVSIFQYRDGSPVGAGARRKARLSPPRRRSCPRPCRRAAGAGRQR
jgi:hypothetical protein